MRSPAASSSSSAAQFGQLLVERARRWSANRGSSPFRLRIALLITVLVALAFTVLATYGVSKRRSSIEAAQHAATQLIVVQGIRVAVVQADAVASQSYLVGGQEDPAQRKAYLGHIAAASNGLVQVALQLNLDDAQTKQLQAAGSSLTLYTGLVEQARANNRQGFPVAAAYQRQANTAATQIVTALRVVENGQRAVVNDNLAAAHRAGAWLVVGGWVLVVLLALGGVWLAFLFRRIVNVPLAVAVVALLAVVIAGGATQAKSMSDADNAVGGALTTADLVAQAQASAYDAQSQEALTLINRGNGSANEASWKQSSQIVTTALGEACDRDSGTCDLVTKFDTYVTGHKAIRAADDGGDWDSAVALSLGKTDPATVFDPFNTFAKDSGAAVSDSAAVAQHDLAGAADQLSIVRILVFIAGLLVALLAAIGYGQRLREYR